MRQFHSGARFSILAAMTTYEGPFKRLGAALKELRCRRGWTQVQLEERSGVSSSNISDYERGKAGMQVEILDRLLAALKCDVGDLADGLGQAPKQAAMLAEFRKLRGDLVGEMERLRRGLASGSRRPDDEAS